MNSHPEQLNDLRFEDLFWEFEDDVNEDELDSPDSESSDNKGGISALTLDLRQSQMTSKDEVENTGRQNAADIAFHWSQLHQERDQTIRMVASIPFASIKHRLGDVCACVDPSTKRNLEQSSI